jgi:hypothetical protein
VGNLSFRPSTFLDVRKSAQVARVNSHDDPERHALVRAPLFLASQLNAARAQRSHFERVLLLALCRLKADPKPRSYGAVSAGSMPVRY